MPTSKEERQAAKEARLLSRLKKLHLRRDLAAWRVSDIDAQISAATKALAKERGVIFLRDDAVRQEVMSA